MKSLFEVKIQSFTNLLEIDGAWSTKNYEALLDVLEFFDRKDMSAADLKEMCLMSLQDLKPEEASYYVLKYRMSSLLKDGQLKNISVEMQDEKLWEEYSDPSLHEELFNVGSLLYSVFPGQFPKPDAVRLTFEVSSKNDLARQDLIRNFNESLVLRILADGMNEGAVLLRLYGDQLRSYSDEEADKILWCLKLENKSENKVSAEVISSGYWLDSLEDVEFFESSAFMGGK